MAGVSESPFRRLCRRFGADVVVTEFLSAEGIRRENEATISKLRFGAGRAPDRRADLRRRPGGHGRGRGVRHRRLPAGLHRHQLRLPGQEGRAGATAARAASRISTWCRTSSAPWPRSTHLPVTCKIRSGWNEEMRDPVAIALRCQDAGARVLALHPRTRTQMYTGAAQWDEIAAVVRGARHPGARQRRHQDGRTTRCACTARPDAPAS